MNTNEVLKLALEALEKLVRFESDSWELGSCRIAGQATRALREALAKPDFWEGYVPEPVKPAQCAPAEDGVCEALDCSNHKPAQQEPRIDIYRSFEQWKRGNVLEHGVPRTEHYSEAQLDLVEMGWNYGYDAGRAVEQALDKKAENARELGLNYEPAQRKPLTDDEVTKHFQENVDTGSLLSFADGVRFAEATHGIAGDK